MGGSVSVLLCALSACGADGGLEYGERASWEVLDPDSVQSDDQSIKVGVSRVDCASGETGEVAEVEVDEGEDEVTIQAFTEPLTGEGYDCPANEVVPVTVEFEDPIGDKTLIDGFCAEDHVTDTAVCDSDLRWSPEESASSNASFRAPTYDWEEDGDHPEALFQGTLALDENRCLYGTRDQDESGLYGVAVPDGTQLAETEDRLLMPDGGEIRLGRSVSVGGGGDPSGERIQQLDPECDFVEEFFSIHSWNN